MIQNVFDSSFSRGIPQHVAAEYFYRVKHAGWADAPDETGALEGAFAAPIEQVIAAIADIATAKFKLMVAYHVYAESMRGEAQHACAEVFHEHAEHERAAAEAYLKRAAALGSGPIHLPEIETPPASSDPVGILMVLARAEQEAIAQQNALRKMVGEDNPLAFQIEAFMVEDQHHLDEVWQLLPPGIPRTPVLDMAAAGAGLPPEAGLPSAPPAPPGPPGPPPSIAGPGGDEGLPELPPQPPAEAGPPPPEGGKPPTAKPPAAKPEPKPEAKPEPAAKEASGLMSFRKSLRAAAPAAEQAAQGAPDPSMFSRAADALHAKFSPTTAPLAAGGAVLGGVSGALGGVAQAGVSNPEDVQLALEDSGPIGRASVRHPILTGAAVGALSGAGIGAGASHLARSVAPNGHVPGRELAKSLGLMAAPSMAGAAASAVDGALYDRELAQTAKSAAVTDALKTVGKKMRAGAVRYGELVTGSKAKNLAFEAGEARDTLKEHAHAAVDLARGRRPRDPQWREGVAGKYKDLMGKARATGDAAKVENTKSRLTQAAHGAAAVGALGVAASKKHDRTLDKVDKTNARLKQAMVAAWDKLALAPPDPGMGTEPGSAPPPDQQQMVLPQPSMAAPGQQPPMSAPPGQRSQYAPVNYLEAEETARRAQEENEANFYRGKVEEANVQSQNMGAQIADISSQLEQLTAQAAESNAQIMAANQEAVQANDQMLNQATLAARMRMGMQQLRAQMMEVASQDPEQLAAAAGGPTPMDVGNQAMAAQGGGMAPPGGDPAAAGGDPMAAGGGAPPDDPMADPGAQPGTPGASPDPASAGPASPPGGSGGPPGGSPGSGNEPKSDGGGSSEKKDGGETTVSIKKGSAYKTADLYRETMQMLPYAGVGAAVGAGAGYVNARKGSAIPSLREKVDALKGQQDGGFGKAIELGKAQFDLGKAEEARANPGRSALRGGLAGASLGGALGAAIPAGISEGGRLVKNLKTVVSNARGA